MSLLLGLHPSGPWHRVTASSAITFPTVPRMLDSQRATMVDLSERAAALSTAATPILLQHLDDPVLRRHLRECCRKKGVASWPAAKLLQELRSQAAAAELVHNFDSHNFETDVTLDILADNATNYFPTLWPLRWLGFFGSTLKAAWGHPQSPEDAAEEGIFRLAPFGGRFDLPRSWEQSASRLHYIALNMLRVDSGNEGFGHVAAIFSPSFRQDAVALSPLDTGLYTYTYTCTYAYAYAYA